MFEPKVFRERLQCIEDKTCDILGTFRCSPVIRRLFGVFCPFRYSPGVTLRNKVRSYEIRRALNLERLLRIERSQLR